MKSIRKFAYFAGISIALVLCCLSEIVGQEYYQGYESEIQGKRFNYHSPLAGDENALLLRGQADFEPIVWSTERIPTTIAEDEINFIWAFGMDVVPDPVEFHLILNGTDVLQFSSASLSKIGPRQIEGEYGVKLLLNVTMLDKYKDQMGFAILTVPKALLKKGEAQVLKLENYQDGNNAWFMTYKTAVKKDIQIYQNKIVLRGPNDTGLHAVSIDFIHIGEPTNAIIKINGFQKDMVLHAGYNSMDFELPKVTETTRYNAEINIGDQASILKEFELGPVKEWEIYLVQHTHTDIGYTRPQTEILPEHLRYIDQALDYCDMTDDYPEASKFRWTIETAWSLRSYLRSRPAAQIERLVKRIQENSIEATGMFFNYSEIIDEAALNAQTKTILEFKAHDIPVSTIMQNDVNGIAWNLIDQLNHTDIKYLTMGVHPHRARLPFDKPTAFWWESAAGNRLLAYRSEHYQHGNSLSLTTGQQDVLEINLSQYLTQLEAKGYPYNKTSIQFSGYITDNSPPTVKVCDIIKSWNEKYEWPKLRSALAKDFMMYLEEEHSEDLQAMQVAWPDWWTDGVGSAMNETKTIRQVQSSMTATSGLMAMAKLAGAQLPSTVQSNIEAVYDNILFYDEHTHGAAESISEPYSQNSVNQWNMKAAYAWDAAKEESMLKETALSQLEPFIQASSRPLITVYNSLNWERSGEVDVFIGYELIPEGIDFRILDELENEVHYLVLEHRMEGAYYRIWANDIPSFGWKSYRIHLNESSTVSLRNTSSSIFENEYYQIDFSKDGKIIKNIIDKELQINLIDQKDSLSLGQLIYERLDNRHELERLTNTNRDTIYKALSLRRTILEEVKFGTIEHNSIYKSIHIEAKLPNCSSEDGIHIEIRLYHDVKLIKLIYRMIKLQVEEPEGLYVAFPFQLDQGHIVFEVQGGEVKPGINQLERTASDWNTIQNYSAIRNNTSQILFVSDEIPLVQFGDLNIGRYYYKLKPKQNHVFSWVLNNYWVTNFKAFQSGEMRWSYSISSEQGNSSSTAAKFGMEQRIPLIARITRPKDDVQKTILNECSYLTTQENILLIKADPEAGSNNISLQLREVNGGSYTLDLNAISEKLNGSVINETNVFGEILNADKQVIVFKPFETKFVKIEIK